MAAQVGVAVFGLGRAGGYHLPNLGSNPSVRVRWLVDVGEMEARAGELCAQHGLDHAVFVTTDQCHRVFEDQSTVAVVVTTPTRFHEDITKRALRAGKHVFCEKPVSFSADVVRSCYEEAEKQDRVLFCGFNKYYIGPAPISRVYPVCRRFDEQHVKLRERVQSGELGSPRLVHYHWRDPMTSAQTAENYITPSGGIFCDSAIHQLDYVPWMLGEKPCSVVAVGTRTSQFADVFKKCDDVDSTLITLTFPSGVYSVIEVTRESHSDDMYFRLEVVGNRGTYLSHKVDRDTQSEVQMDGQGGDKRAPLTFWSAYKNEMDCFVRVLQGKEACPVPARDVIQASRLADLCLVSLREGRVIPCDV